MSRVRIQPYRQGSRSARALSEASGILRVRLVRTRFRPRPDDIILNWGSSQALFEGAEYVNRPEAVAVAGNKLLTYQRINGKPFCPPWTTDRYEAEEWLEQGHTVLARTLLRANSGRGIVPVEPGGELPDAPLYVQYLKKADEFRVHVWDGGVLDVQQKRRRRDHDEIIDSRIRNASKGWVFCRESVKCPTAVMDSALQTVALLGLDFGAVDIGWNRHYGRPTVYECNTAPGLEGTTLAQYAERAKSLRLD